MHFVALFADSFYLDTGICLTVCLRRWAIRYLVLWTPDRVTILRGLEGSKSIMSSRIR